MRKIYKMGIFQALGANELELSTLNRLKQSEIYDDCEIWCL